LGNHVHMLFGEKRSDSEHESQENKRWRSEVGSRQECEMAIARKVCLAILAVAMHTGIYRQCPPRTDYPRKTVSNINVNLSRRRQVQLTEIASRDDVDNPRVYLVNLRQPTLGDWSMYVRSHTLHSNSRSSPLSCVCTHATIHSSS